MKNYFEELDRFLAKREQEKAALCDQLQKLQDQRSADKKIMEDALKSGDNSAYLEAHRRFQEYDLQIAGLKDLLAAKEKISIQPEIIAALNNAIGSFEKDHKKAMKKYMEAKRALAEMYVEACHEENNMKKIVAKYYPIGKIDFPDGKINKIPSAESFHPNALKYFRDELISLGYDFGAIVIGKQEF